MPRTGISYDDVAAAADEMTAEGNNPSIQKVRYRLGTGSSNTIHKHLTAWKSAHPQMVAAMLGSPDCSTNAIGPKRVNARSEAEVKMEKLVEELSVLTTGRDMLLGQVQQQRCEINRLAKENEHERYNSELARLATEQIRIKHNLQEEKLLELSATTDHMTAAHAAESQARISAEKEVAILSVKVELGDERQMILILANNELLGEVCAARNAAETARIETAKTKHELELQSALLAGHKSTINELTDFYKTELNAQRVADDKTAILTARLETQENTTNNLKT